MKFQNQHWFRKTVKLKKIATTEDFTSLLDYLSEISNRIKFKEDIHSVTNLADYISFYSLEIESD